MRTLILIICTLFMVNPVMASLTPEQYNDIQQIIKDHNFVTWDSYYQDKQDMKTIKEMEGRINEAYKPSRTENLIGGLVYTGLCLWGITQNSSYGTITGLFFGWQGYVRFGEVVK